MTSKDETQQKNPKKIEYLKKNTERSSTDIYNGKQTTNNCLF